MIKVKVLKRHVEKAKKIRFNSNAPENCPIALAIKEKQKRKVNVNYIFIGIKQNTYENQYVIPQKAIQFMKDFDKSNYDKLKTPFTFEISRAGS